jgi:hypothetical protein
MADTSLLLQALQASQQAPYQRNPFIGYANSAPVATSEYGQAAENIIKGLVGGYGFSQANQEAADNVQQIMQARKDRNYNLLLQRPDLAPAANVFMLQDIETDQAMQLARQKQQLEDRSALNRAFYDKGMVPDIQSGQVKMIPGFTDGISAIEKAKADAQLGIDRRKLDQQRELEKQDRAFKNVMDVRKEFQGLPEVKNYVTSEIGYRSLQKAMEDPSAASDLEIIRGAIQAIEPGMAVREGEQAAVAASASIPGQYKGWLTKALSGESALPPEVREGVMRIAERRYQEHASMFNKARDFYSGQAGKVGEGVYDGNSVTYLPSAQIPGQQQAVPQEQAAPAMPEGAEPTGRTSGGKPVFRLPNGQLWTAD